MGPKPETIEAMGDKTAARRLAVECGVPVVPGTNDALVDAEQVGGWGVRARLLDVVSGRARLVPLAWVLERRCLLPLVLHALSPPWLERRPGRLQQGRAGLPPLPTLCPPAGSTRHLITFHPHTHS